MLHETFAEGWRPVKRPVAKSNSGTFIRQYRSKPPPVPPKPGRKVITYVYDTEPEYSQQDYIAPEAKQRPKSAVNGPGTPRQRVRERSKRSSRGYKVLADVVSI